MSARNACKCSFIFSICSFMLYNCVLIDYHVRVNAIIANGRNIQFNT
jgi:hypothetical protein